MGGRVGEELGAVKGVWNGSWMTMSLVKSSSGWGVGRSGGRLRASATLLDSPVTCLKSLVNNRCLSACKDQVEVEWALVMELVRGL